MDKYITVQLSKKGIHNKMSCIISVEDTDLVAHDWNVLYRKRGSYVRRTVRIDGKRVTVLMHRIILERKIGRELAQGEYVDHINGDGLDNRRENLRIASLSENSQNTRTRGNNTSGQKGVNWRKDIQKWQVRIGVNGKRLHLGQFDTFEEAQSTYIEAAKTYHKEFSTNR